MRERMARFMMGRNGMDQLAKFFLVISIIFLVLTLFTNNPIIYLLALAALLYSYFRMMSRNVQKRYYENQKYMQWTYGVRNFFAGAGKKASYQRSKAAYDREQRKMYKIFYCPSCKQKIRVPKGKGKVCITCPKCKMDFLKRT
jgi:flagellar biosynthesis component FlhA